jgi:molecular chaperone DnaJ
VPKKLNREQRKALEEFAKLTGDDAHPVGKHFWNRFSK